MLAFITSNLLELRHVCRHKRLGEEIQILALVNSWFPYTQKRKATQMGGLSKPFRRTSRISEQISWTTSTCHKTQKSKKASILTQAWIFHTYLWTTKRNRRTLTAATARYEERSGAVQVDEVTGILSPEFWQHNKIERVMAIFPTELC